MEDTSNITPVDLSDTVYEQCNINTGNDGIRIHVSQGVECSTRTIKHVIGFPVLAL